MPDTPPAGIMRLTIRLPWEPAVPAPTATGQKVHVAIAGESLGQGTIVGFASVEDGHGLRVSVEIQRWPTRPCDSCDKLVIWTVTTNGRRMPVDAEQTAGGNVRVYTETGAVRAEVVPAKHAFGRTDLRKAHFATCPDADSWRKGLDAEHRRSASSGRRRGGAS